MPECQKMRRCERLGGEYDGSICSGCSEVRRAAVRRDGKEATRSVAQRGIAGLLQTRRQYYYYYYYYYYYLPYLGAREN